MNITEKRRQDELASRYLARFKELREVKEPMLPIIREIVDYLYPARAGLDFDDTERISSAGELIFDGEPLAALARLKDGLFGWLVNPSLDWLKLAPSNRKYDQNELAAKYLEELQSEVLEMFARSNFYDSLSQDFGDCAALGTSVILVEKDEKNKRPAYVPLHIREFFISEDISGNVDTLYREFELANRHILEKFGKNLKEQGREGEALIKALRESPDKKGRILHVLEPRNTFVNEGVKFKTDLPFTSDYLLLGLGANGAASHTSARAFLEEGGTEDQRHLAWRFEKIPCYPYGFCPGRNAIFDIKMINIISKTMADAAQLAAKPPFQAPETLRGKVRVAPGGITYREGDEEVKPLMTSLSYPLGIDAMERRARIIREHFKTDYFMSVSQIQNTSRERTKAEILEMKAESAATLGSIIGRIQTERLDPLVRLSIVLGIKNGWLPKPPEELPRDFAFTAQYVSPLMQSQRKYVRVQGLTQGLASLGQMNQIDPDAFLNIKAVDVERELLKANGFPAEYLESRDNVDKARKAAAEQRAAMAKMQMENERLAAMGRGARAAESGSPTAAMLGKE